MSERRFGELVRVHEDAWVAPSAQIYGAVELAEGVSVWHNAVLRAECQQIRIGRRTNLQDFVMVHVGYDAPTHVGEFCSITHHATIHGCTLGDACLVGIGAVIYDGAVIGDGSIVAGGAVVREGASFGPGSIIAGVPARQIGERDASEENRWNAVMYHRNAECTRRGDHRAWVGPDFEAWRRKQRAP